MSEAQRNEIPLELLVMRRVWAMPNHDTFSIKPIKEFVLKHLNGAAVSVDPYARNTEFCMHRNDMNPSTKAPYHLDATNFLRHLHSEGVTADIVVIDPPYSPRQVKECYDSFGHKMKQGDALLGAVRKQLKAAINDILRPGGKVLWFGWNSVGMGKTLGFELQELMLVCHGSDHNDTICTAEVKAPNAVLSGAAPQQPKRHADEPRPPRTRG